MSLNEFPTTLINEVTYNDTASVTLAANTSTQIIAANPNRKSLILTNIGSEGAWIKCNGTAAVNKGMFLGPQGVGVATMDSGALTKGPIAGRPSKTGKTTLIAIEEGE